MGRQRRILLREAAKQEDFHGFEDQKKGLE